MRHEKMRPVRGHAVRESKIVDLNTATVDQIANVPGIGPRIAEAIVGQRPLRGWDDVKGLPGVSQGLIKQLRNGGVRIGPAIRHVGGG
jgi:DNA uptake protein ComE-like DNA-binding protein